MLDRTGFESQRGRLGGTVSGVSSHALSLPLDNRQIN